MPSLNTKLASAPNTSANYVLKATSSTTIGNSLIQDDGTNVAIGTTPGTYKLNVSGTFNATGAATFSSSVTGGARIQAQGSNGAGATQGGFLINYNSNASSRSWLINNDQEVFGDFAIMTSTTQTGSTYTSRLYINSSGNVGIGTTSPSQRLSVTSADNTSGTNIARFAAANNTLAIGIGYETIRQTETGGIIAFETNGSERMRITSGGLVAIGTTSAIINESSLAVTSNGNTATFKSTLNGGNCLLLWNSGGTGNISFFTGSSYTAAGTITSSGTTTSYNTSSDYRLKKDYKDYNALDLVSKIKTYDFAWNLDNTRMYGVIAHELKEVIPYSVQGEKDGKDMQGVDYSKLVPVLVKAIQEQQSIIDGLNQRLNALENK